MHERSTASDDGPDLTEFGQALGRLFDAAAATRTLPYSDKVEVSQADLMLVMQVVAVTLKAASIALHGRG